MQPAKVREGDLAYVKQLLESDSKWIGYKSHGGESLLHYACESGNADLVRFLVKSGVPVNRLSDFGLTAAYEAIRHGHKESLEILVENGVDIFQRDSQYLQKVSAFIEVDRPLSPAAVIRETRLVPSLKAQFGTNRSLC